MPTTNIYCVWRIESWFVCKFLSPPFQGSSTDAMKHRAGTLKCRNLCTLVHLSTSQQYVTVRRPIQGKSKCNIVSVFNYHAPKVKRKIEVTLHAFYISTLRRRSLKVTFTTYEQEARWVPVVRTAMSYKHQPLPPPPKKNPRPFDTT
jgi:hypothetical protein